MKFLKLFLLAIIMMVSSTASAAEISVININVDPARVNKVVDTIYKVDDYMKTHFDDRTLRVDVKVYLATDSQYLKDMFTISELGSDRVGGRSRLGVIQVIADESKTDERLCFLVAHELIHQYQASALGGMEFLGRNMWLTEGMADVLAVKILDDSSLENRFLRNAEKYNAEGLLLKDITQKRDWNVAFNKGLHPYAKADLAVWYLANNYPEEYMFLALDKLTTRTAADALTEVYGSALPEIEGMSGTAVAIDPFEIDMWGF